MKKQIITGFLVCAMVITASACGQKKREPIENNEIEAEQKISDAVSLEETLKTEGIESTEEIQETQEKEEAQEADAEEDIKETSATNLQSWAKINVKTADYKETKLPLDAWSEFSDYGVNNIMIDTDGRLISYAVKDMSKQGYILSWEEGIQEEKAFPTEKAVKELNKRIYQITPCMFGSERGYVSRLYRRKKQDYVFHLWNEKGTLERTLPVEKYIKENIDKAVWQIQDIMQTEKNHIAVFVTAYNESSYRKAMENTLYEWYSEAWDACYLLDINVKTGELCGVEESGSFLIGADDTYRYGLLGDWFFSSETDFKDMYMVIENRETGTVESVAKIPNDITSEYNESISQEFEFKNHTAFLANRTGIYTFKPEDDFFCQIMKPESSSYLNLDHTMWGFAAEDENTFYILTMFGEDDETADILIKYERK